MLRRRGPGMMEVTILLQLDEDVPPGLPQRDEAGARELLREVAEAADAVGALGERRVELQQRALEKPELRRDLAVDQHLERAPHERHDLLDRRLRRGGARGSARAAIAATAAADLVLVGDELVAVALHHLARERAPADDEDLLVVLLELLDERDEVAVAPDDHVPVDVRVRERPLEGVEREVDVGAVLVAARREVALHEFGCVLRERPAVVAGARPVAISGLTDDVAALLERFEHDADVELGIEGVFDADLDVVEIDEDGNLEALFWHVQNDDYPATLTLKRSMRVVGDSPLTGVDSILSRTSRPSITRPKTVYW